MSKRIRIGTRDSQLALWQANTVKLKLDDLGYQAEIVSVKSTGDLVLDKPLYELGITGIFTKTLDAAILNGSVDIAVHSMKDVPTLLPIGIVQTAVLARATATDIIITNGVPDFKTESTIATGSLRRKAQWLHKYPHHKISGLRGNVNTRLQKLKASDWSGAIFAKAGLERINVLPPNFIELDWMIPAPAQGAMVVVSHEDNTYCREATAKLNDPNSEISTHVERDFLRTLEGGCTAPIGALATIAGDQITLTGALFSLDGQAKIDMIKSAPIASHLNFGSQCANRLLKNGGSELMAQIKNEMNKE